MADLYDEEILSKAVRATRRVKGGTIAGLLVTSEIRMALDAVAPLIAAKALRDMADYVQGLFEAADDLYAGDMVSMLDRRADEVERGAE